MNLSIIKKNTYIPNGTLSIRTLDILLSLIGLIIASPLFLIIYLLIKSTSEGPAIFTQRRLGLFRKEFNLYKFRSMKLDAEKDGPKWSEANDPRVTIIGKWLRKTRLDELPQLINVLKGEISLVGPRPIREFFANKLSLMHDKYEQRFLLKPGLTGWAQIYAPYGSTTEEQLEKLNYDLKYLDKFAVSDYLIALLKTTKVVLLGKGL